MPRPAIRKMPPASVMLSVHPGTGSSSEAPIIEGLIINKGMRFGLFAYSMCSAILFEKVYVLWKLPRMLDW